MSGKNAKREHPEMSFPPPCEDNKCRVNSRRNPNCFCQLGEKFWFSTIKDSHWTNFKDPEIERKEELGYVGLKNLGATCYVNTFLQLWFKNEAFRSAIYRWKRSIHLQPAEIINDDGEMFRSLSLDYGECSSAAICGNLQYLFSLLQYSQRRYVDPASFVKSLGLQPDEQQDAQEFSKLFISLLKETLSTQHESLSNLIDNQFGGSYKYETCCTVCGNISQTSSKYYELDLNIKGHLKLVECLKEFLKEEFLEGENQYFCCMCMCKQNAIRRIVLETLPPVLNIQLLRFVFDRQTGNKKKLNTTISFPDTIDMNEYMAFENREDGLYHLNAVLIHCGLSAHSGHYIAHILDKDKDVWCRYNDESVTVMKGKLSLGKEDDPEGGEEEKGKKTKKGEHSSKNAYMLVYSRSVPESVSCDVPEEMVEFVAKDNSLFEEWVTARKQIRNHSLEEGGDKQRFIQRVYPILPVKNDGDAEWISTSWLRQWLSSDCKAIPPIDNTSLLCNHANPNPEKIPAMKRISVQVADNLFTHYGGELRLANILCELCLENRRKKEHFEEKLADDYKEIIKNVMVSEGYWVSKKGLKRFKQLARVRYSLLDEPMKPHENGTQQQENTDMVVDTKTEDEKDEKTYDLQEDITCTDHDQLNLNENNRKIVSVEVWSKCIEYFPDAKVYPHDIKPCQNCQRQFEDSLQEKETLKFLVKEQKQKLAFLFEDSTQRMNTVLNGEDATFHVILSTFIHQWKKVMKSGGSLGHLLVDNTDVICEHDLLLYTAEEIIDESMGQNPEIYLLSASEHLALQDFYTVPDDVQLTRRTIKNNEKNMENVDYGVVPDFCPSCRQNRLRSDAEDSRHFTAAAIFVSKNVSKKDKKKTELGGSGGSSEEPPKMEIIDNELSFVPTASPVVEKEKGGYEKDNNYIVSTKRLKLDGESMRRSSRKRTKRGEYMILVNSHQSLKDLKIQVLGLFSVLPIEQTLSIDGGVELDGDDKYLIDLGVSPGCHIILTSPEPSKRLLIPAESSDKPRILEAGFKGTNLLCGSPS